jgi:hypothetical protein
MLLAILHFPSPIVLVGSTNPPAGERATTITTSATSPSPLSSTRPLPPRPSRRQPWGQQERGREQPPQVSLRAEERALAAPPPHRDACASAVSQTASASSSHRPAALAAQATAAARAAAGSSSPAQPLGLGSCLRGGGGRPRHIAPAGRVRLGISGSVGRAGGSGSSSGAGGSSSAAAASGACAGTSFSGASPRSRVLQRQRRPSPKPPGRPPLRRPGRRREGRAPERLHVSALR